MSAKHMTSRVQIFDEEKPREQPFVITHQGGIDALNGWLRRRQYNSFVTGSVDRFGNDLIGLSWDYDPDSDYSKNWVKRGLIIVKDRTFLGAAEALVDKHRKVEEQV